MSNFNKEELMDNYGALLNQAVLISKYSDKYFDIGHIINATKTKLVVLIYDHFKNTNIRVEYRKFKYDTNWAAHKYPYSSDSERSYKYTTCDIIPSADVEETVKKFNEQKAIRKQRAKENLELAKQNELASIRERETDVQNFWNIAGCILWESAKKITTSAGTLYIIENDSIDKIDIINILCSEDDIINGRPIRAGVSSIRQYNTTDHDNSIALRYTSGSYSEFNEIDVPHMMYRIFKY
jgi:hypothetical protein